MYQHKDKGKKGVNRNTKAEHQWKVQLINTDFVLHFLLLFIWFLIKIMGTHVSLNTFYLILIQ